MSDTASIRESLLSEIGNLEKSCREMETLKKEMSGEEGEVEEIIQNLKEALLELYDSLKSLDGISEKLQDDSTQLPTDSKIQNNVFVDVPGTDTCRDLPPSYTDSCSDSPSSSDGEPEDDGPRLGFKNLQTQFQNVEVSLSQFANWEKYTKAIGSTIMKSMGYEMGQPLGHPDRPKELGDPIVVPIPIRIIPSGLSLDYISRPQAPRKRRKNKKNFCIQNMVSSGVVCDPNDSNFGTRTCTVRSDAPGDVFGWMNDSLSQGIGTYADKVKKDSEFSENRHKYNMSILIKAKKSDKGLRNELIDVQQKIEQLRVRLRLEEDNHQRHAGQSGISSLRSAYWAEVQSMRQELSRLQEHESVISSKMSQRQDVKKMKAF